MASKQLSISMPCPVCQGPVKVREVECPDCNITIRGDFGSVGENGAAISGSRYDKLNADQAVFLETFLRCRGIIRDVEAALGISYPTVRGRLDALLEALDLSEGAQAGRTAPPALPAPPQPSAKDILSRLDSGSIDATAALDALRGGPDSNSR